MLSVILLLRSLKKEIRHLKLSFTVNGAKLGIIRRKEGRYAAEKLVEEMFVMKTKGVLML